MLKLSPDTQQLVDLLFQPADRRKAAKLLTEQCGNNLPFLGNENEYTLERIRFAALKRSGGSLDKLRKAVSLAKEDWRDLLVAAGFAYKVTAGGFADNVDAHERWLRKTLTAGDRVESAKPRRGNSRASRRPAE